MRRLRYNVASTLDGYIASPDGSTDWIIDDPAIDFNALYASFSTFVMGRKTWETLLALGEQNPLRGMPRDAVVVFSRTMRPEEHTDVTVIDKNVVEHVARLKTTSGNIDKDIWLYGGGQLATCLLKAKLVDTVEVAIMPALIGSGIRMIGDDESACWKLKLEQVDRLDTGILMCRYSLAY